MSNGSALPLTACDDDCAAVNHCDIKGGVKCENCGLYFCVYDLNERGLCEDCAENEDEDEDGGGND